MAFCQAGYLEIRLRRMVMFAGTSPWIAGSAPPNMMFSPVASRKLFSIRYGPGPFHPQIACVSMPCPLMLLICQLRIDVSALLRAMPRLLPNCECPWM